MKIAVVSRNEKHLLEIARLVREHNPGDELNLSAGSLERFSSTAGTNMPDLLLLDQPQGGELARLEALGAAHPRTTIMVLSAEQTVEFMMEAMRAGVREVLPAPVTATTLFPALARVREKLAQHEHVNGKVLAFVSCKGGSGATFLATNIAYALATECSQRVALIDLNLQFGDASLFVSDHKPQATLTDIALQIHRLDASLLASSMMPITTTFSLLAAPDDPVHAGDIRPAHVDTLLALARRHYDFVILDVGRSLDPVGVRALDMADTIFPVLQTTLPYVRDGKRLLEVFRSLGYPPAKVQVIVNRHQKNAHVKLNDLEAACGTSIWCLVPNHFATAAASVNQGIPVLKLSAKNPIARSLTGMARDLAGNAAPAPASWLARLLGKPVRNALPAAQPTLAQPAVVQPPVVQPALAIKQPAFEEKQVWMQKS